MQQELSTTYSLRRLKGSDDRDYPAAIQIYISNISPGSRTNSNEIAYWIDNYPKCYDDEFVVCGFYADALLIGYAQFVYFRRLRFVFFDYLILHEHFRSRGEYFQFARMLRGWLQKQSYEIDYVVAEVAYETSTSAPSKRSLGLAELFQWIGFSVAECEYFQPPLGLHNPESDMRAHLLIWASDHPESIKRDTLLGLVKAVYFEHYERWYRPFLPDIAPYHELLVSRCERLRQSINTSLDITLNGVKSEITGLSQAPALARNRHPLAIVTLGVVTIMVECLGLLLLRDWFDLSERDLLTIVGASVVVFATIFALFYRRGERVLSILLNWVRDVWAAGENHVAAKRSDKRKKLKHTVQQGKTHRPVRVLGEKVRERH